MSDWRKNISELVDGYEKLYFYTADPGASASLLPVYEEAERQGKNGEWFVEGWAAYAYLPNAVNITGDSNFIKSRNFTQQAIVIGQQVDFSKANERLLYFKNLGLSVIFISDHWKNISGIFAPRNKMQALLPDIFLVPDDVAYKLQSEWLLEAGFSKDEIARCLKTFLHPGVEASLERIKNFKCCAELKKKYEIDDLCIVMMLDCINPKERNVLGFDWKDCLKQAIEYYQRHYPMAKFLVKAHPRQDIGGVCKYLSSSYAGEKIALVDENQAEPLIAIADEVWGITTVLLVVALKAGKTIKVFMPNRTAEGARESNLHIEKFLVN